ncbi:MAG: asparaginase [Deltaproteobacteria bacterium]|nr:asparaginase [Deltaproteobacteria bacterium]
MTSKKVLMLHTGGTLGMSGQRPEPLRPDTYTHRMLEHVPELSRLAALDVEILFNLDSSNVTPRHWDDIGRRIHQRHDDYDGFVVVHGTDTMAYTASACAFLLEGLRKPVVFTGSQRPLGQVRSDARSNLVGAVEMATQDIPEVTVFFDSKLLRGVRTVKSDVWGYAAFDSPNFPPLAEAGVDLLIRPDRVRRPAGPRRLAAGFSAPVACLEVTPGFAPALVEAAVDAGARGLVLRAFGSGNVPDQDGAVPPAIGRVVQRGVPVVLVTQAWRGGADLHLYECGQRALDAGAVDGGDLTTPAAVVKLAWLLTAGRDVEGVRAAFAQDLRGEGGMAARRPMKGATG